MGFAYFHAMSRWIALANRHGWCECATCSYAMMLRFAEANGLKQWQMNFIDLPNAWTEGK